MEHGLTRQPYDLLIRGGSVVFPGRGVRRADVAISGKTIAVIGENLHVPAARTIDAQSKVVIPGVIDSHFHLGIFRPMGDDAETESSSAVAGGVTTVLIYYRAGRHNLIDDVQAGLPPRYLELLPRIHEEVRGRFRCDYGFNVAPVSQAHVDEIPDLVQQHGIRTFKYYMHYRGLPPGSSPAEGEREYVYSDTGYDLGHLHAVMARLAEINASGTPVRLSIHAEHPAIIRENTVLARHPMASLPDNALQLYSRSRPPTSERLGILIAAELARQTGCPINILHVSSALALETIREVRAAYQGLDLMAEATVHHLALANDEYGQSDAKVNPPIRAARDRDALWSGIRAREIQTAVSDHAAILRSQKGEDIWGAWYGFGGTELLLPTLLTLGYRDRGIPLERVTELLSLAPARFHGLSGWKGDIAVGLDADVAIVDLETTRRVDHRKLHSAQDFSPFSGMELTGWVDTTIVRGEVVFEGGEFVGAPVGRPVLPASSPTLGV